MLILGTILAILAALAGGVALYIRSLRRDGWL